MSSRADTTPRRRMPASVVVAFVWMWINAAVGIAFGIAGAFIPGLVLGGAWGIVAIRVTMRSGWSRTAGIVLGIVGFVLALAEGRIEFGTNIIIVIALLMPSAPSWFQGSEPPRV